MLFVTDNLWFFKSLSYFSPMKNKISFLLYIPLVFNLACEKTIKDTEADFPTPYELSSRSETATYEETLDFYKKLAKEFPSINMQTIGTTDSGLPLHVVTFNEEGNFNFKKLGENKTIILINNGIHPGESDGIDATMLLYRNLASHKLMPPKDVIISTIPIYNVGGSLNRNSMTRANQNGPNSYGFRGNAKNYDLNRDFIKADTKNAKTFAEIYHLINPDVFIDNHVSNGADYQYTLTHLFTQHNKLGGEMGSYIHDQLMPQLKDSLQKEDWEITPYVNVFNRPPETGFSQFMDFPRYSTGYTTLWNTLGMMVETHMLKPYDKRVAGTYALMQKLIGIVDKDAQHIRTLRDGSFENWYGQRYYPITWEIDTTRSSSLNFKGFKADTIVSAITGFDRLKYDRQQPMERLVKYQDYFKPSDSVEIPQAYIVKKAWTNVIDRLVQNHIKFETVKSDTLLQVQSYRITSYETVNSPYEGHYLHSQTKVDSKLVPLNLEAGDILIYTEQPGIRYLLETLEPEAPDSFFNWNFFDTILQQKEGFSPYVFEDTALEMLQNDSVLRKEFESKKESDIEFSQSWYAQLDWLFKRSPHYEKAHLQYPIYRLLKAPKE